MLVLTIVLLWPFISWFLDGRLVGVTILKGNSNTHSCNLRFQWTLLPFHVSNSFCSEFSVMEMKLKYQNRSMNSEGVNGII